MGDTLASSAPSQASSGGQRRRRTSSAAAKNPVPLNLSAKASQDRLGASSGTGGYGQPLPPIPQTPRGNMSLSRSPSPQRGGGWSSPGLTYESGNSSPRRTYGDVQVNGTAGSGVTWESANARTDEVKSYASRSTPSQGFFARHVRKISHSLPIFDLGKDYAQKEKLGRGRWAPNQQTRTGRALSSLGRQLWRMRTKLMVVFAFLLAYILFYATRELNSRK